MSSKYKHSATQSQIGALVQKDNVLGMLVGRLSEATEKERQAPLESFFLQFLANFVTASPVNSVLNAANQRVLWCISC